MTADAVIITINGSKYHPVPDMALSYRDIADIAGFKSPLLPSMTVKRKGVEGCIMHRIVHPGESVMPIDGMVFNVADTSNA